VGQRLDGAAGPFHRPPTGTAWQWVAGISMTAFGFAETRCAREQYVLHNQAQLMSSMATWW
jgi:hypothetical protein